MFLGPGAVLLWICAGYCGALIGEFRITTAAQAVPDLELTGRASVIEELKSWDAAQLERTVLEAGEQFRAWYWAQTTGVCEAHGISMRRIWQPVGYGYPAARDDDELEEEYYAPHRDSGYFPGGCVVGPIKEEEVYVCDACTSGFNRFLELRSQTRPNKSLQPTATAVTLPAGAGSAPAVAVAEH